MCAGRIIKYLYCVSTHCYDGMRSDMEKSVDNHLINEQVDIIQVLVRGFVHALIETDLWLPTELPDTMIHQAIA